MSKNDREWSPGHFEQLSALETSSFQSLLFLPESKFQNHAAEPRPERNAKNG